MRDESQSLDSVTMDTLILKNFVNVTFSSFDRFLETNDSLTLSFSLISIALHCFDKDLSSHRGSVFIFGRLNLHKWTIHCQIR